MKLGIELLKHHLVKGYLCLAVVVTCWTASGYLTQGTATIYNFDNWVALPIYSMTFGLILLLPLTWRKVSMCDLPTVPQMGILGVLWLICQVLFVLALMYSSMATVTAVSASSTAFSYLFSVIILKYKLRLVSVLSVLVAIGGVVLTACFKGKALASDSDEKVINETVYGIVMALVAAVGSGLFSCLFKKWVKEDTNSGIVFGSFGFVGITVGIPVIIICHFSGIQEFQVPCWQAALRIVADAFMCSVVCNFFYSKTFIYLTPVIISVGLTMMIPITFILTALILRTHEYPPLAIFGVCLIFLAVVAVSYDQAKYEKEESRRKQAVVDEDQTAVSEKTNISEATKLAPSTVQSQ